VAEPVGVPPSAGKGVVVAAGELVADAPPLSVGAGVRVAVAADGVAVCDGVSDGVTSGV
jgi:hypothetical protein